MEDIFCICYFRRKVLTNIHFRKINSDLLLFSFLLKYECYYIFFVEFKLLIFKVDHAQHRNKTAEILNYLLNKGTFSNTTTDGRPCHSGGSWV